MANFVMVALMIIPVAAQNMNPMASLNMNPMAAQNMNPMYDQSYPGPCSDITCRSDQCCIETHRSSTCVGLLLNVTSGQSYCVRLKKCKSNEDCPKGTCCVWAIDTTAGQSCPKQNLYDPYNRQYKGQNYNQVRQVEGYCKAGVLSGSACYVPIPGMSRPGCPCLNTAERCVSVLDPFPIGICRAPQL
ncbi:uncharacterized protein LOC131941889 [Physella acuta]|uniref:uncharacterized protein LOC131941889 n=1 Tax=Physella acuta TaxID=109671 RepID=UPI0027DAD846|nr:uncharacterized protein LOC131941889 [Physella acuta]